MLYVAQANLVPILVAVLIGFITGWLIWRGSRAEPEVIEKRDHLAEHQVPTQGTFARVSTAPIQPRHDPVPPAAARRVVVSPADEQDADEPPVVPGVDGPEGNDVVSGAAAAAEDVVGQFLGVDAHPGPDAGAGDDLQKLKGVGPKLAGILRGEGLTRYDQIAALSSDDLARLDLKLGAFKGRLQRDRVVEQAALLARGDVGAYEAAFGRL